MKFLIADGSSRDRGLLRAGLESEGHQVAEASNGAEALAILAREPVDAVITDIPLPSMDGFRLCHEIRKGPDRYRNIPIILYNAYGALADPALAEAVGADGHIPKPASATVLIAAAQEAMRRATVHPIGGSGADAHVLEYHNAVLLKMLARQAAALDAANRELETLSFSVSHDLRAPLRRVSGFAQLLGEAAAAQLDDDHRELLSHITAGAAQMSQLIEALLEFSRAGRAELHFAEIDLDLLIDKAISDLRPKAAGRVIEWRRGTLPRVRGDAILLHQVLANLLSNAMKYTRTRNPAIIEIGTLEGGANEVVVLVRDNGVGFDLRYAGRLFGVFQRMHRAEEFEGSGIGLAIAQRIVMHHGGAIWADAAVGSGATFYVSLPRT